MAELDIKGIRKGFGIAYVVIFLSFYCIVPLFFMGNSVNPEITQRMAAITVLSTAVFCFSYFVDFFPPVRKRYIFISRRKFNWFIYSIYLIIVLIIFGTSSGQIPILASLNGADSSSLVSMREAFLKERTGFGSWLSYIITLVDTTFLPFVIIGAFKNKLRGRKLFLATYLLYSISFLQKGYFLKIAIPVFIYFYFRAKNKKTYLLYSATVLFALIFGMFSLSKMDAVEVYRDEPFFSIYHIPQTMLDSVIWRMIGVPVITAYDGFELFFNDFHPNYFHGATSSLLASIFGLERVNFERLLYQNQFGGSETGNANQYYLVEAFVNFGIFGVILFSFIVGKFAKDLIKSKDLGTICIVPLFFYAIFNAGLIANFLSNGFLFFYLFTKIFRVVDKN